MPRLLDTPVNPEKNDAWAIEYDAWAIRYEQQAQ